MAANDILNTLNYRDREKIYGKHLDANEIRLVELMPTDGETPSCSMTKSTLHARPFIAISYCWGDLTHPLLVSVNDTEYRVSKQVVDILNLLSTRQRPPVRVAAHDPANKLRRQLIWIDAICINQEDVTEREMQMTMMKSIYETASCTMLYLGKAPKGNESAKTVLNWLSSLVVDPIQQFVALPKEVQLQRWNPQCWALVVELLEESPWWRRRWTVQEAVVSKEVWVVYGAELLKWEVFADAILRCSYMVSGLTNQPNFQLQSEVAPTADVSPTRAITRLRSRLADGKPAPQLFEILLRFRRCDCMKPDERIFALLGLCKDAEVQRNEVDLGLGELLTFKRFVLSYIDLYKNLDILCASLQIARLRRHPFPVELEGLNVFPDPPNVAKMKYLPDLPSWVPNFTSFRVEWQLGPNLEASESFEPVFAASRGCPASLPNLHDADDTNVLSVTGIEIDRIAAFHPNSPIEYPKQNTNVSQHWWSYWYWTQSGSQVPHVYPSHDARWVAFLRTIGAGSRCGASDRILSDAYVRHYGEQFFGGTLLGRLWHDTMGLRGPLPSNAKDYYLPPWPDATQGFLPPIFFNQLCFSRLVRGASGRIGLAPPRTKVEDRIVVLFGCSSPLLLEDVPGSPNHFRIRGEAYMHGYMFGEAIQLWRQGLLPSRTYHLV